MKNPLSLVIYSVFLIVASAGCSGFRPYHATPVEALTEFPGYLAEAETSLVHILKQETMAGGIILLYRFPSPTHEDPGYCVATTFVTQERTGGWRAQSASRLACGARLLENGKFKAAYTVGGNVTELTTAYGIGEGHQARITWSDGQEDTALLENGVFLKSRPATLRVERIALLDEAGETLAIQSWAEEPP